MMTTHLADELADRFGVTRAAAQRRVGRNWPRPWPVMTARAGATTVHRVAQFGLAVGGGREPRR